MKTPYNNPDFVFSSLGLLGNSLQVKTFPAQTRSSAGDARPQVAKGNRDCA